MSEHLLKVLRDLDSVPILVLGDLILDRYVYGDVRRVSPEAPIVVFSSGPEKFHLGGALNVADNLRSLGVPTAVAGVIGEDGYGRLLRERIAQAGLGGEGLITDPGRPTTVKTRYVARNNQQVLRVDQEETYHLNADLQARVFDFIDRELEKFSAVVVSDYGKGVLTPQTLAHLISRARVAGIPVHIDPKGKDYSIYRGATLITPNRKEAEEVTGIALDSVERLRQAAEQLLSSIELDAVVITLGRDGVYFRTREGVDCMVPTEARSVFDVTGAGDTVIAVLTWTRSAGAGLDDAVRIANHAAGIVVARPGAATVTREELEARVDEMRVHAGKVIDPAEIEGVVESLRRHGRSIVFTNGCFDLIHPGHVRYLREARAQGDVLIVGVNSDESIRRLKGPERPICPLADRMQVLAALEMVDFVVPFEEDTPEALIRKLTPHVLVKGEDWRGNVVGADWVESHGGRVHLAPLVAGISTTEIIRRISEAGGQDPPPRSS